jgi:hypothetical protein
MMIESQKNSLSLLAGLPRPITFVEGQILRAQDLKDEQSYRQRLRHLHNLALHAPGVFKGLSLEASTDPRGFWLDPGFAIDGLGRELVVPRPVFTSWDLKDSDGNTINRFDRVGSRAYTPEGNDLFQYQHMDVWLRYRVRRSQDRSFEETALCLTAVSALPPDSKLGLEARPAPVNPSRPPGVSPDLYEDPTGVNPLKAMDAGEDAEWPVYLGRLTRQVTSSQDGTTSSSYSLEPRPAALGALLVGESVHSASRVPIPEDPENPRPSVPEPVPTAQMILGDELFKDRLHFAVRLPDEKGRLVEKFSLDRPGGGTISGDLTLARFPTMSFRDQAYDLRLESLPQQDRDEELPDPERPGCRLPGPSVGDASALVFTALPSPPKQALPWHVYRTEVAEQGRKIQELRIEMGNSGDPKTPQRNQLQVGSWHIENGTEQFYPCLIVRENCEVEFTGPEITLIGSYITDPALKPPVQTAPDEPAPPTPPAAVPPTGEAFLEELARQWAAGIGSGAGVATSLSMRMDNLARSQNGQSFSYQLTVTNDDGLPLSFISIAESVRIGNNNPIPTRLVGGIFQLPPKASNLVQVDHPPLNLPALPATVSVVISLTVIAFDPAFKPLYATREFNRLI